jgi:prevent-host-death family protein
LDGAVETLPLIGQRTCSYDRHVKTVPSILVGVRDLKNRLTSYLKLVKEDQEVIVTERGKPIAVIQPIGGAGAPRSREAKLAALAARGVLTLPERAPTRHLRRVKIAGRPLSEQIIADRR